MKGILCITTYPPRECGIATFSGDLIRAVLNKFGESYSIHVCALESQTEKHLYSDRVKYILNTSDVTDYEFVAKEINADNEISLVLIEHEFGLFEEQEDAFLRFLQTITKPVIIGFHTVLPHPKPVRKEYLRQIIDACSSVIVMTQISAHILQHEYQIAESKINLIPHGTHLVSHSDKKSLKEKYKVSGRPVLSTFGLLSPGKSIETSLDALPGIVEKNPSVIFLIIGKTHPTVLKTQGEKYREMLQQKVIDLGLTDSVRFVNLYLDLPILLEYLQLTDIYLFTSSDPNQAVSGTFVYAMSCGCPIIATPIPHALELLKEKLGMREPLIYSLPPVNTEHIKRMSRNFAMIQFSRGNRPDIKTGYTLDDNVRALMAMSQVYAEMNDLSCGKYIKNYLAFIRHCLQPDGSFLNYVDKDIVFTAQNQEVNLEDSNGRAVYALGYFISYAGKFPDLWTFDAIQIVKQTLPMIAQIQSPRSIAFALKGLCYYFRKFPSSDIFSLICSLADKLMAYYHKNNKGNWSWFETNLTYDNSTLPESLLYAYLATGDTNYKETAKESFDFLLGKIFTKNQIKVIPNQSWLPKAKENHKFGEQPVDVAGTVIALKAFYKVFKEVEYLKKQRMAFDWFLGKNHLGQIVYNPATGGCYDGLEEHNINLNQGAESTVSYLMARLSIT